MRLARFAMRLSVVIAAASFTCCSTAFADGPQDNSSETVRPVPPPGIEVPADVRRDLESRLATLQAMIADLAKRNDPRTNELLCDVQIFAKAADWALRYNEVFSKDDLVRIATCLAEGLSRADSLVKGESPWANATGLVVRGYASKIDGSVQPYGLVLPESYTPKTAGRYRTDIWFHGRGETLSEANFIADRMKNVGQFAPADTIVLHPYGRYCNAFKLAGEEDVLEALDSVKRRYRVDEDRISVRGFSMGGAAAWHFAVHYPTRWFAANPGAGFSETPEFLRVFQKEEIKPTPWEKSLLHYYDCTDWATNLRYCPTVAYSGELDSQKQAADIMAEAMGREGLWLRHVIGPGTKHQYHPAAAREVESRMEHLAAEAAVGKRLMHPYITRLKTFTLAYNKTGWATIDAVGEHWSDASIEYELEENAINLSPPGMFDRLAVQPTFDVHVRVKQVTAFSFVIPPGIIDGNAIMRMKVNGEPLTDLPTPQSDRSWEASFHLQDGKWKSGRDETPGLRKRHGLQGPIDDAFLDSFLFVRPTGKAKHEAVDKWSRAELDRAIREWRRQMRGDVRVKDDTAVTDADIAAHNLVLWGDADSNALLKRIADKLPIRWGAGEIAVGDAKFPAEHHAVAMIYPNPLNPKRYVVLNSSFTYREYDYLNNARQVPKLPDWAVIDLRTPPGPRYPGKIVAADFFDEAWQLKLPKPQK